MKNFIPFSKKIYAILFVLILALFVLCSVFFLTKKDNTGFSFANNLNASNPTDAIDNNSNYEDDFFSLEENIASKSHKFQTTSRDNEIISFDSSVSLSDFSRFYNYYIPIGMDYIIAAYHYENLNSDEVLPLDNWSSEDFENTFMSNSGQYIYDLFIIKSAGKTLDYGFIPLNKNVFESITYQNFLSHYLN